MNGPFGRLSSGDSSKEKNPCSPLSFWKEVKSPLAAFEGDGGRGSCSVGFSRVS